MYFGAHTFWHILYCDSCMPASSPVWWGSVPCPPPPCCSTVLQAFLYDPGFNYSCLALLCKQVSRFSSQELYMHTKSRGHPSPTVSTHLQACSCGSQFTDDGGEQGAGVGHQDTRVCGLILRHHLSHGVCHNHQQPVQNLLERYVTGTHSRWLQMVRIIPLSST